MSQQLPDWTTQPRAERTLWGYKMLVERRGDTERWVGYGLAGHRTSFHVHPNHDQWIGSKGKMEVVYRRGTALASGIWMVGEASLLLLKGIAHELRFVENTEFAEEYYGPLPVFPTGHLKIFQ